MERQKQPLVEIRERTLQNQAKFMQSRSDDDYDNMDHESVAKLLKAVNEHIAGESIESMRMRLKNIERTRHDLSTIANHGHLVFMVSCLYDPAIHYTNAEYENLTGCKNVDIRIKVEAPEVYIVARSGSSDVEQLTYIETCRECLEDLSLKLKIDANTAGLTDTMCFFSTVTAQPVSWNLGSRKEGTFTAPGCGASA